MKEDWKDFTVSKRKPDAIREKPDAERIRQFEARKKIENLKDQIALENEFNYLK